MASVQPELQAELTRNVEKTVYCWRPPAAQSLKQPLERDAPSALVVQSAVGLVKLQDLSGSHCVSKVPCITTCYSRRVALPGHAYGVCAVNSGVATSLRRGGGGGQECGGGRYWLRCVCMLGSGSGRSSTVIARRQEVHECLQPFPNPPILSPFPTFTCTILGDTQ